MSRFCWHPNSAYCSREGAVLVHRNRQLSHFYPDLEHSPSSPVICTFFSFRDCHKRLLQSIHSLISTQNILFFAKHVFTLTSPLQKREIRDCCHFTYQTFRVKDISEPRSRLLKQKCNLNKSAKNQLRKAYAAVATTKESFGSQKEGVNLCRNRIRRCFGYCSTRCSGAAAPPYLQLSRGQTQSTTLQMWVTTNSRYRRKSVGLNRKLQRTISEM